MTDVLPARAREQRGRNHGGLPRRVVRWPSMPPELRAAVDVLHGELTRRRGNRPVSAAWEFELLPEVDRLLHLAVNGSVPGIDQPLRDRLGRDPAFHDDFAWWVFVRASALWPLSMLVYQDAVEEVQRVSGEWLINDGEQTPSVEGQAPSDFAGESVRAEDARIETWLRDKVFALTGVHASAHFNDEAPLAEATLPTVLGPLRFAAALAPAVSGLATVALTVRVPRTNAPQSFEEFIQAETMTPGIARFLEACVRGRCNIVFCGETGAGKTALLRAACKLVEPDEVLVTVEDKAELWLDLPGRDGNAYHRRTIALDTVTGAWKSAVQPATMEDLVRHALRHRPRRIVLGEARGGEMFDVCHAATAGHAGWMVTIHANSAEEAIQRAEVCVAMSPQFLGQIEGARPLVRQAIHVSVHLGRHPLTGRRIVDGIVTYSAEGGVREVYAWSDSRQAMQRQVGSALEELPARIAGRVARYLQEIPDAWD